MTKSKPRFSIFIPTFNRANTLPRALASIDEQSYRDFEVVIVDDGSTDDTASVVENWRKEQNFPTTYVWQPNQGKHAAHNTALDHVHGELFVVLDSDDALTKHALEILNRHWESIPEHERRGYAGVEGLTAFFDGTVAGTPFPEDVMDTDYVTLRRNYRIKGDKKNALRTELLRQWPYPRFDGERHMRPSWLLKNLSRDYRFRYINEVIQWIEYQPGGLSWDRFPLRMRNPRGYRQYHLEEVNLHSRGKPLGARITACASYIRYTLHAGIGWRENCSAIHERWLWWISLPGGLAKWTRDTWRIRREGDPRRNAQP